MVKKKLLNQNNYLFTEWQIVTDFREKVFKNNNNKIIFSKTGYQLYSFKSNFGQFKNITVQPPRPFN